MSGFSRAPKSSPKLVQSLPRLLLVEDDVTLRDVLGRTLEARFEVISLPDGVSAAARLKADRFDVVLSDVHLRGMNGIDLLRLVRAVDLDVPVILMTGLPDVDSAIQAMDLGALTYIRKPFDLTILDAALDRATKLAALARAKREAIDAGFGKMAGSSELAALTASFDRALDSMWIAFQPIVDGRSRRTVGFEALMRSNEPTMPSPSAVLDAAERLDRIHDVGRRVRELTAAAFDDAEDDTLVFVNLHSADLLDDDLFDEKAPLSKLSRRVVLELTERAAISDLSDARRRATELRRRGFKIAIDDLGAGYAGLTSFATFEPEIVKLDMSLVRDIDRSPTSQRVVAALTAMCQSLGVLTVAEGVETQAERDTVVELGCDLLQGYFFARPTRGIPQV